MSETGGAAPPEGRGIAEASGNLPPDSGADRQTSQLPGIERDLDTADAALAVLDAGDLEGAEALAAELEDSAVDTAPTTADNA